MSATLSLIDLAGAIALLLWGLHMVQSGIQRAFGPNLRRFLGRALGGRLRAFAAGIGVTAILQSSTATGLMAASFAAGGLVDLVPALAIMLGANLGTTLIVQLLSFDIGRVAPLFVLIGVILFRKSAQSRSRDLGRVAIGLGERRSRREAAAGRQSCEPAHWLRARPAVARLGRTADRQPRAGSGARRRRFPYAVQSSDGGIVPAAPGAVRPVAGASIAGADGAKRPVAAALFGRGSARGASPCPGGRGAP